MVNTAETMVCQINDNGTNISFRCGRGQKCCQPMQCCPINYGGRQHKTHELWYFWVIIVAIVAIIFSIIAICICQIYPKRQMFLLRRPPEASLKTARDSQGIIKPDVVFFTMTSSQTKTPVYEPEFVAEPQSGFRFDSSPVATDPLGPAYHPIRPITITRTHPIIQTDSVITLPPGYVDNVDDKWA
ncbi:Uncharacterised protein g4657 [Pycnogonum litorale]